MPANFSNFAALEPRVSERVITVMSSVVNDTTGFVHADKEEALVRVVTLGALITDARRRRPSASSTGTGTRSTHTARRPRPLPAAPWQKGLFFLALGETISSSNYPMLRTPSVKLWKSVRLTDLK